MNAKKESGVIRLGILREKIKRQDTGNSFHNKTDKIMDTALPVNIQNIILLCKI
jgi:hypothetical protein